MSNLTAEEIKGKLADKPGDCELYLELGIALHREGQISEARETFSHGLAINPFHVLLRQQRGRKHMAANFWQAVSDFRLVTRLQPSYWEAWYYMGVTYALNDHTQEALDAFKRCLREAKPAGVSLIPIVDWLYMLNMKLGDVTAAVQVLKEAGDEPADPEDEEYGYARRVMLYKGLLTPANFFDREVLKARGNTDIDFVTQAYGLANWLSLQGKRDEAQTLLLDIVRHDQYPTAFAWLLAKKDLKDAGIEIQTEEKP
jgi:tetratricopeptide (TPR) repeat protein